MFMILCERLQKLFYQNTASFYLHISFSVSIQRPKGHNITLFGVLTFSDTPEKFAQANLAALQSSSLVNFDLCIHQILMY